MSEETAKRIKANQQYFADCLVGFSWTEEGESGYAWAVFNRKDIPQSLIDEHLDKESDFDLAHRLTGWEPFYRGPGQTFASSAYCKIGRNRILVRQHRGLDI